MTSMSQFSPSSVSPRARWHALGLAIAVEGLVIAAVLAASAKHSPAASFIELPVAILSAEPPLQASPAPPPTPQPARETRPVKESASPPPLPRTVEQILAPATTVPSEPPDAVQSTHDAVSTPVAAPPAAVPPPPAPSVPSVPSAEYIALVKAAVQAAFEYPPAAKALDFKGRARVAFNLTDCRPSGARVVVSSGMSIVDRAAQRAVEGATYPPVPDSMRRVEQSFEVWVNFGL
jgi:protein TonB